MSWIKGNRYLSETEMQNNASIIKAYLVSKGWTLQSIAGVLGNMETESSINPGIWQSLNEGNMSGGYGLVQWTPATNFTDWADTNGYNWDDGDAQLLWIDSVTVSFGQWIPTTEYDFSFASFKTSTQTPEYLASAFLMNFERAGVEKEEERRSQAQKWYSFISEEESSTSFTPRLDSEGIEGSFYYYSQNPFYLAGYGLPNCTCYAWGRFWEISDTTGEGANKPTLPTGDAGTWFPNVTGYQTGNTPKLGAVICWSKEGAAGHVAIVEKIEDNGDIVTSNSAYNSTFFYTKTIYKSDGYSFGDYVFQGFIYNPFVSSSGGSDTPSINPSITKTKRKKYKFLLFKQKRRIF